MTDHHSTISRRNLLAGLGVAGGAAVLGGAIPASAGASPAPPVTPGRAQSRLHPDSPPGGLSPISSAPEVGVSYVFCNWSDFTPEDDLAYGRKFGGGGFYTNGAADYLGATVALPPGAILHDLEWYVSNTVSMNVYANIWQSSAASLDTFFSASIAAGSGVHAERFVISSSVNGPYPHGTKLLVAAGTATDGSQLVNGVRVGLRNAPLSPVLLATPTRLYDSRDHSPLAAGGTRTISLATLLPVGANGAMFTLTALDTHGYGSLHVGAAGSALAAAGVVWGATGDRASNSITCAVNSSREIGVHAYTNSTDFIIDVTGYLV